MPKKYCLTGFTLIELIIVAVILTVLASVALVRYSNVMEKARSAEAYSVLSDIVSAENGYFVENNAYTSTITQLDRYEAVPQSSNFDFEVSSTDANSGYASAKGKGSAQHSYGMCLKSAKKNASACAAGSACDPGCP